MANTATATGTLVAGGDAISPISGFNGKSPTLDNSDLFRCGMSSADATVTGSITGATFDWKLTRPDKTVLRVPCTFSASASHLVFPDGRYTDVAVELAGATSSYSGTAVVSISASGPQNF